MSDDEPVLNQVIQRGTDLVATGVECCGTLALAVWNPASVETVVAPPNLDKQRSRQRFEALAGIRSRYAGMKTDKSAVGAAAIRERLPNHLQEPGDLRAQAR
ncbi:MAG: hypothetical protein AAGG65_04185 [Pseudomonadota bacterium]